LESAHLPLARWVPPSTDIDLGIFFVGSLRFFDGGSAAVAERASNVSRERVFDGSLISPETPLRVTLNALAASAREPKYRHATSPTRLISQAFGSPE